MLADLYRSLYRIRRVEEEVARIYPTDRIKSPCHLSIGQEAVSVGVCEALRPTDVAFGTYRGHALYLAKGGDLRKMIAELYGKATGCAGGKGGSMHLVDVEAGVMGASAIVGTSLPQSVGYAYALKLERKGRLVASFFGDGATEEGAFHESLLFAALKKVPLLLICENNGYAIHARQTDRQPADNLCERVRAYGIPAQRIEGNDVRELYAHVKQAVDTIRTGKGGPYFFECMTYRWMEHVGPNTDWHAGYRSRTEADPWIDTDQVRIIGDLLDCESRCALEAEVEAEIRDAFQFAEESPWPDPSQLTTDIFEENSLGTLTYIR